MILSKIACLREKRSQRSAVFFALAVLIMGMFVCAGCSSVNWARKGSSGADNVDLNVPEQLQVAVDLRIDDIPVPEGFKLDADNSFAFQNDYTRVGLLIYRGRANTSQVIEFYKEQMPLYNWSLVNIVEYSRSLLNFEKENQSCIITCEPSKTTIKTVITIATAPKSKKMTK